MFADSSATSTPRYIYNENVVKGQTEVLPVFYSDYQGLSHLSLLLQLFV